MAQLLPAYKGDEPYVFVSYSHTDEDIVFEEISRLQALGVNVWYDTTGIGPGGEWNDEIAQAIKGARNFLYFITPRSVASEHCRRELSFAQSENRRIIVAHLQETDLPDGLRLSLENRQAILKHRLSSNDFHDALPKALSSGELNPKTDGPLHSSLARRSQNGPRWGGAFLVSAVAITVAAVMWWYATRMPGNATEVASIERSIAVLPFVNMSNDPEQEFFSDGVAEEILNQLSRNPALKVISRTSSFSFKGKMVDLPTIAEQLNVSHVLEGSVRRAGERVRIQAQLIDVQTDANLWSATYDRNLGDVFAVQDEIAKNVAGELRVAFVGNEAHRARPSGEAYASFLQARFLLNQFDARNHGEVQRLLEDAVAKEPNYIDAWVQYARLYYRQWQAGTISRDLYRRYQNETVSKALAIDSRHAAAIAWDAGGTLEFTRDMSAAAERITEAFALDPTDIEVAKIISLMAVRFGRVTQSIELWHHIVAHDPLCGICRNNLAWAYELAERYDEAEEQLRVARSLGVNTDTRSAMIMLYKGDATAALEKLILAEPSAAQAAGVAMAMHTLALQEESRNQVAILREKWGASHPIQVARAYAWLGENDQAFEWLNRPMPNLPVLSEVAFLDPVIRKLAGDPRWDAFLARYNNSPEELARIDFSYVLPTQ